MATLIQKINYTRPFKRIRNEVSAVRSKITEFVNGFDSIHQAIAFERFYHNQTMRDCESIDFKDNHFVLFDYPYHHICNTSNLGDHIQTIATKNALDSIYKSANYEYFGRDYLAYYNGALSHNHYGGGESLIAHRNA